MLGLLGVISYTSPRTDISVLGKMIEASGGKSSPHDTWREGPATLVTPSQASACSRLVDDDLVVILNGWIEGERASPRHARAQLTQANELAHRWRKQGVDAAAQIEGEYVALIYERGSGVLHILRDPIGTKPLFWARAPSRFAYASDPLALLHLPWVSRELAREHLAEYLTFRTVHPPRTMLRDVFALPAGHRLRADTDGVRVIQTSRPRYAAPHAPAPPTADVIRELGEAVQHAVRRRLNADDQVGVYLSGGTGSTALIAAARAAARRLRTYTVTFAEEPSPESPFAGRVAKLLGMDHRTVTVSGHQIALNFDTTVSAMGLPVGHVAAVLQYILADHVSQDGVKTILTGDGTDQLFGGQRLREPAAVIKRAERIAQIPWPLRHGLKTALRPLGRGDTLNTVPDQVALAHGFGGVSLLNGAGRRQLLLDDTLTAPDIRHEVLAPYYHQVRTDPINTVLHVMFQSVLLADILPRVERTVSHHGMTAGFPLLDADVRRLAQLLPGTFKVDGVGKHNLPTRWLLRAVLPGNLPSVLINRTDRSYPMPLDDWLTGTGRAFFDARFSALRADPLGLWHSTGLEALRHQLTRNRSATRAMWALFVLDAWCRVARVN